MTLNLRGGNLYPRRIDSGVQRRHGIRDKNSLEAAIMRPQAGYYKNIFEEAAALMESLAMNHSFIDGNKRVSCCNGYILAVK